MKPLVGHLHRHLIQISNTGGIVCIFLAKTGYLSNENRLVIFRF